MTMNFRLVPQTRYGLSPLYFLIPGVFGLVLGMSASSFPDDSKPKPRETKQQTSKSAEPPSQVKEAHKALKSMDTKIPAETSKAVRSTKEFFKKRFRTNPESSKEHK